MPAVIPGVETMGGFSGKWQGFCAGFAGMYGKMRHYLHILGKVDILPALWYTSFHVNEQTFVNKEGFPFTAEDSGRYRSIR